MTATAQQKVESSQKNVRLDIQGLRALSVILVVLFHLGLPIPGGFVGVDVFFVISGYVITAMLEREWQSQGTIKILNFFRRRFWRLTPALAIVVAVTLIVGSGVVSAIAPKNSPQQIMVATGIGAVFLCANLVIAKLTGSYFDNSAETNVLLNTWSLSVEEQFYIGFLFILIFGWVLGRALKRQKMVVFVLVLLVFLTSLSVTLLAQPGGKLDTSNWLFHFYSPVNRAWEFAAGALIALGAKGLASVPTRVRNLTSTLGISLIIYSALFLSGNTVWPGVYTAIPVIGSVLVIALPVDPESKFFSVLANKVAVFIGDRSYSLYLWHWPVIVIVGYFEINHTLELVVDSLITILLTLFTYRFIENKFRHRSGANSRASILTAITIFAIPVLAVLLVNFSLKHNYWNDNLAKQHSALATKRIGETHSCNSAISYLHRSEKNCTWNSESTGTPIYLIGDSNAEQFSDAMVEATTKTGNPLVVANRYGCPFLTPKYVQPDRSAQMIRRDLSCSKYYLETFTWLKMQKPGLVVISNTESYVTVPRLQVASFENAESKTENQYFSLLSQTVKDLDSAGFSVALILGPPHFDSDNPNFPKQYDWNPTKCNLQSIFNNSCKSTMPIALVDSYQSNYLKSMRSVANETHANLIDVSRFFCNEKSCSTQRNGLQIYRDGSHITVGADLELVPKFVKEIRRITNSSK